MVQGRKEILSGNRPARQQPKSNEEGKEEADGEGKPKEKETNKEKRNRLREQKKAKQKVNNNTWRQGTQIKTQEEIDESKRN